MERLLLIKKYADFVLTYLLFFFAFLFPFNQYLGHFLTNQMFYAWILSFNFIRLKDIFLHSTAFKLVIVSLCWILLSQSWSTDAWKTDYITEVFKFLVLPFLIIVSSLNKKIIKKLIYLFLIAMFINELFSYAIYFNIINSFFGIFFTGSSGDPVPFQASHMEYSIYLSITVLILMYNIFHSQDNLRKIVYSVFIFTMLINLFLSAGRSGQATLLLTALSLIFIYSGLQYKKVLAGLFVLTLTFYLAYYNSETFHERVNNAYLNVEKVFTEGNYYSSFGVRLSSYKILPIIIDEIPILYGVGLNNVDLFIHKIHMRVFAENSTYKTQEGHLHNSYITIFVSTGLIGIVLLLLSWYWLLFKLKIKNHYINYMKYVVFINLFFAGFTENLFRQREIMLLYSFFTAIVLYQNYIENRDK